MRIFLAGLLIASFFFSSLVQAADGNETYLNAVTTQVEDGSLKMEFDLSNSISAKTTDVKFLRRTIEWDLKGILLKKDKIFLNVGKNDVNNIYASQVGNNATRIRINLDANKVASNYHDRVVFSKSGNRLTLKLDSSIPLISNNITELNRIYDIEPGQESSSANSKIANVLDQKATLKVSADPTKAVVPVPADGVTTSATADADDEAAAALIDDSKSESEIPLIVKKETSKEAGSSPWARIMIGVGVLCALLLSVMFVNKKIQARKSGGAFNQDSIVVVSQKYLGPKRCLTLVRVSGEYLLLGVTDHNISLVKSLSVINDELPALDPKDFGSATQASFGSTIKGMQQKIEESEDVTAMAEDTEDSFTVSSLSDVKKIMRKRKYIDEADM
ncbi:MAG: flagellar biosynthetic protein FliO [Bdellovibrionales bacterium]|nr:flagellar biosynthetic protein FliO [Bdellovibrionales bacterium]